MTLLHALTFIFGLMFGIIILKIHTKDVTDENKRLKRNNAGLIENNSQLVDLVNELNEKLNHKSRISKIKL